MIGPATPEPEEEHPAEEPERAVKESMLWEMEQSSDRGEKEGIHEFEYSFEEAHEPPPQAGEPHEEMGVCGNCGRSIPLTSTRCPYCGVQFVSDDQP